MPTYRQKCPSPSGMWRCVQECAHVLAHKMGWIWFHAKVNSPPAEVLADMDDMHHTSFLLSAELVLLLTNQSFPDRSVQKEKLWLHNFVTFGFYFFFCKREHKLELLSSWQLSEAGPSKSAQVNLQPAIKNFVFTFFFYWDWQQYSVRINCEITE